MTRRQDFTPEQWQAIRNAPQLVAMAVAAASRSGFFGTLSEGMAAASAFAAARRGNNALIKEVFDREEIWAAQSDLREALGAVTDAAEAGRRLQEEAIAATRAALAALRARDARADAEDYRKMIAWLAEEVANAAREGGVFGFGGERISEGEEKFLGKLYEVVGREPEPPEDVLL